jgi:hypothetical protein
VLDTVVFIYIIYMYQIIGIITAFLFTLFVLAKYKTIISEIRIKFNVDIILSNMMFFTLFVLMWCLTVTLWPIAMFIFICFIIAD